VARQRGEQLALADELIEQLLAHLGRGVRQGREELDRYRLVPHLVPRAIDHGEPALADDALDAVFLADDGAHKAESVAHVGVGCARARHFSGTSVLPGPSAA